MDKQQVISKIAEHYRITRNIDFANFFDIIPQTALSWTKEGRYNIYEVYRRCPDINPEWLLSLGEVGPMLRPEAGGEQKDDTPLDRILDKTLDRLAEEQAISRKALENIERALKIAENKNAEGEAEK